MKKVYFISGLGADRRVFAFLDLSFCEPVFIDWIDPLKNESLPQYALRLRDVIKEVEPSIVGLSFGGMLVTEMAKADPRIKAVIISSAKLQAEIPWYFKFLRYFPVHKMIPPVLLKKASFRFKGLFGVQKKEHKRIFNQLLADTDAGFLKWAISAIVGWKNQLKPANIIHIHGTADRILPYRLITADHSIKNGTHMMPLNNPQEIDELIKRYLLAN